MGRVARVLVIEDDCLFALCVEDVLRDLGCPDITLARDLASGFAALERGSPDLAILDVRVRDNLIYPLAEELARRKIPFIFCTGTHHTALPARWNTHPLIAKPVPKECLARALGKALQPPLLQY